jgi:hypothetical protein
VYQGICSICVARYVRFRDAEPDPEISRAESSDQELPTTGLEREEIIAPLKKYKVCGCGIIKIRSKLCGSAKTRICPEQ